MNAIQYSRTGLVVLLMLAAACDSELPQAASQGDTEQARPNIFFIIADDLGYSDLGAFGGEISTPNLDALASTGVRLTDFHVAPMCAPTRAMLFTGVDHHRAGFGTMVELMTPDQRGRTGYEGYLNDRVVTIAALLRDAGYGTYIAGKWHLGRDEEHAPQAYGFDESFVLMEGAASHFDQTGILDVEPVATYRDNGQKAELPEDFYSSEFFTDKLIGYLDRHDDEVRPFLATLAFTAPHWPLHAPDEFIERYSGDYADGYETTRSERMARMKELGLAPSDAQPYRGATVWPDWQDLPKDLQRREARKMEVYAAMLEAMDFHVGRLIDYLKTTGAYDNTLIIFMSDNGADGNNIYNVAGNADWIPGNFDNALDNLGRPGSYVAYGPGWAQVGSTPFRLYKAYPTEGGIRAPAIISGPGVTRIGELLTNFVDVTDIAPTVLEFANVENHNGTYADRNVFPMHGTSIAPYLAGRTNSVHPDTKAAAWELLGRRAVRRGDWKLVLMESPWGPGEWELFDLANDPGETKNMAAEHRDIVMQLKAAWHDYEGDNEVLLVERPPAYSSGLNYYTQRE